MNKINLQNLFDNFHDWNMSGGTRVIEYEGTYFDTSHIVCLASEFQTERKSKDKNPLYYIHVLLSNGDEYTIEHVDLGNIHNDINTLMPNGFIFEG